MEHNFHDEANNVQDLAGKEAIAKLKALQKMQEYACLLPTQQMPQCLADLWLCRR